VRGFALAAGVILAASSSGWAASGHQHGHGGGHGAGHGASQDQAAKPYAGMEQRPIKALSPEEIAGLRDGQGLGMALPAELNGYPGPRHVLDMADDLALSPHQRHQTGEAFAEMKARAADLGVAVIEAERGLDRLFAAGTADQAAIDEATAKVASLRGRLRATHLGYHLLMRQILTAQQVSTYNRLRGYRVE